MWFEGSWEGKRGHLLMALVAVLCVPPLDHCKVARTINLAEASTFLVISETSNNLWRKKIKAQIYYHPQNLLRNYSSLFDIVLGSCTPRLMKESKLSRRRQIYSQIYLYLIKFIRR